jgi:hypothetical protein
MKILQVVARASPTSLLSQDLSIGAGIAASVNVGEVFEKKSRPTKECRPRPVMIDRKRVKPSLDIGEILEKQRCHVGVDFVAVRNWQVSAGTSPRFPTFLTVCGLRELAQGKIVPDIPSHARQLANAVSQAGNEA